MKPNIYLRTDKKNIDGLFPVYLRIIISRRKKEYSLNIHAKENAWNLKTCTVKNTDAEHARKNKLISKYRNKAQNILDNFIFNDKVATLQEFDAHFKNKLYGNVDFYKFVENEFKERITADKKETLRAYTSQLSKLKQFKKELTFAELNLTFIQSYKKYMIDKLKNKENTFFKSLGMLKTFTNWAVEKNIVKENPFTEIKISKIPGTRDFLNTDEVKRLEDLYNSAEVTSGVKNVLRYFLFTCYTGLRYRDIKDLRFSDIKTEKHKDKTIKIIEINMHKTGLPVKIPIIPKAEAYMPQMITKKQVIFNVKTGTTTNKHLVKAAKLANVKKHITFHTARYTVGSTGLENGIAIETLSDILGHTDIRITKRLYAKTDSGFKYNEMLKFETKTV